MLEAISEDSTPELVSRRGVDPASIILLECNPQNLSSQPAESPPRSSGGGFTGRTTNALNIWHEKLAYFEEQEAIVSDPPRNSPFGNRLRQPGNVLRKWKPIRGQMDHWVCEDGKPVYSHCQERL